MSNLDDGYDEIIDTRMLVSPASEYRHDILHLKRRYHGNIELYDSPEFRMLKKRLQRIVGEIEASWIMDENL